MQDLRYVLRSLTGNPVFSLTAVLTLGLGIGANTAVFSVLESVILAPLPYEEPEQMVRIVQVISETPEVAFPVTAPAFVDYREGIAGLESVAACHNYQVWGPTLTGRGTPQRVTMLPVSAGFFEVYRARPLFGRTFLRADEQGTNLMVILSHRFWKALTGGDPTILGQSLILDGVPLEVVGIMPETFVGMVGTAPMNTYSAMSSDVDLWIPHNFTEGEYNIPVVSKVWNNRGNHYLSVIGRLKPGVSVEQLQAQLDTMSESQAERFSRHKGWSARAVLLHEDIIGATDTMLYVLMGAAGLLLLIACVNVANLFLARCLAKRWEFALRAALGAGRLRLLQQLLAESLTVAFVGGLFGFFLATWGVWALLTLSPGSLPRAQEISPDFALFAFAFGVTLLTGLLFGIVPAWRFANPNLDQVLREADRRGTAGAGTGWTRAALVVGQIGLALVLLIGSGLLMKSFLNLQKVELGFRSGDVMTLEIHLPDATYGEPSDRVAFHRTFADRIQAVPGVEKVGAVSYLPVTGMFNNWSLKVRSGDGEIMSSGAQFRIVEGDYFEALGIPLLKGRFFERTDDGDAPPVVVVNRMMAEKHFPGRDPLREEIYRNERWWKIVGVVENVAHDHQGNVSSKVYLPHAQFADINRAMKQVIATETHRTDLLEIARRELAAIDPGLVVHNPRPMSEVMKASIAREEFAFTLMSVFAAVAVMLAAVGIYGVLAYSVSQRTREMGIRMAMGADSRDVRFVVIRQCGFLTVLGLAAGLAGAFALSRLLDSMLFEVGVRDPLIFTCAPLALCFVAGLAGFIPARRATRIDPMEALRYE
jgi:predicted permease